ncbi:PEP-CTERM sorting domain-containing protein [Aquabacterium sp. A7-Y]|uniref:PEP-CTERM sorting domain-containing protein n=1 Tax=Aquabacterium sp. A7-Y TaxID=1349605 RepID=UPI00223CA516|nr:PEP-CTERM sorting domain-containing protein [Aquabacterium sp. A7-Y]MCW7540970.1 PEP-CTERM sorting domain-containing protein [Aquabacterium sp. A7-Y]
MAADTLWTGGAGPREPFWDLADNWSAGLPASFETRALLGSSQTVLRAGGFRASQVIGDGSLRLAGGTLDLQGAGSLLGHLDLAGGHLGSRAELTAGTLRWTGGGLRPAPDHWSANVALTVRGAATLSGSMDVGDGAVVRLNGPTRWEDGTSSIDIGWSSFTIGPEAVFRDETVTGNHTFENALGGQGDLRVQGRYLKTGTGSTTINMKSVRIDRGAVLDLRGGQFLLKTNHGGLYNEGELNVAGAKLSLVGYQSGFGNDGRVHVLRGGTIDVDTGEGGVGGAGTWQVDTAGRVVVSDAGRHGGPPHPDLASVFSGGAIRNEGTFTFRGGAYGGGSVHSGHFVIRKEVDIGGRGSFEVLDGVGLTIERDLDVGHLRIGQPRPYRAEAPDWEHHFSQLAVTGSLRVERLDWEDGYLDAGGPVTVAGLVRLSNDWATWGGQPSRTQGKEINTTFTFLDRAVWDGDGSIFGNGVIRVAKGARFEDHNSQGTLEYEGTWIRRPTRLAVGAFANGGRYEKWGAGTTVIQARFGNRGTVLSAGAGPLILAGPVDNNGTFEVVRSRLSIWGPLKQLKEATLTGGRYVARNGTLVFKLPDGPDPIQPPSIVANNATLVLDGPDARVVTPWLGGDENALSRLQTNTGRIEVLHGANLTTTLSLVNRGELWVADGSSVRAGDLFFQLQESGHAAPFTWLDGVIQARYISFSEGSVGPGTRTRSGVATVIGATSFGETNRLLLNVQDGLTFDQVRVIGSAYLGGAVLIDFLGGDPATGSFRILTATGSIEGRFASLTSNLDPAEFHLSATYAPNYVDLKVTAVPEPGTWCLALLGLALLGVQERMRRRCT